MQNKRFTILFALIALVSFQTVLAQPSQAVLSYIARYKDLAMAEMQRTGIPAAITLAQGIHETDAGTSVLVLKSNNHFGIKCKENWRGQSVSHDDDAKGECFRKYDAPEDSYKDHSNFLKTRPNYTALFALDPTDYQAWAYGLKKAGYATNPKYAQVLIKLIQDYHLDDYTLIAMGRMNEDEIFVRNGKTEEQKQPDVIQANEKNDEEQREEATGFLAGKENTDKKPVPYPTVQTVSYPSGEFRINETRVVYVTKGTSYLTIAQRFEIPLVKLFEFNDLKQTEITDYDQLVFIQRKRKTGDHESHVVRPGETLIDIAQTEAIRLESLLEYNNLGSDMQPAPGQVLNLRTKSGSTPRLAVNDYKNSKNNSNDDAVVNNEPVQKSSHYKKDSFVFHKVRPKETVYSIAKKYEVPANMIIRWNQLDDNHLVVGQSLKIYK